MWEFDNLDRNKTYSILFIVYIYIINWDISFNVCKISFILYITY